MGYRLWSYLVSEDSDATVVGSSCLANGDDGNAVASPRLLATALPASQLHCYPGVHYRGRRRGFRVVAAVAMGINGACRESSGQGAAKKVPRSLSNGGKTVFKSGRPGVPRKG